MNYAVLQQSVNRLLANIWAWIAFIPAFVSSTPQDVSITLVDTGGDETKVVHPNIMKMRGGLMLAKPIGDNLDINELVESGLFHIVLTNATNKPGGITRSHDGYLTVIKTDREDLVQVMQEIRVIESNEIYHRRRTNGAWTTWARIAEPMGEGQQWIDETANRLKDETYTNTSNRPIMVIVTARSNDTVRVFIEIDGAATIGSSDDGGGVYEAISSVQVIVPVGSTYEVSGVIGSISWMELK